MSKVSLGRRRKGAQRIVTREKATQHYGRRKFASILASEGIVLTAP